MLWKVCVVLLCTGAFVQAGVNFQKLTFADALTKAKTEKNLLFVVYYTEWCGPCKVMTGEVFQNKEVSDVINGACVLVKFDLEKGGDKELTKKYDVKNFPTYLIIRPDGTLQHRATGAAFPDDLLPKLHRWFNPKTFLDYLSKRAGKGK